MSSCRSTCCGKFESSEILQEGLMRIMKKIYEGKAKIVYELDDTAEECLIEYKNSLTAFDGTKKDSIAGKGSLNARISAKIFEFLSNNGVDTHFVKLENLGEDRFAHVCKKVTILPLEVVCRNIAAGSFSRRYGVQEGTPLKNPVIEFFLKNDALHDPLITEQGAVSLGLATPTEIEYLKTQALLINELLRYFFDRLGLILVDFKLEFGRTSDGRILLADEITPDTVRIWDKKTLEIVDKDRFRRDLGNVLGAYEDLWNRIQDNPLIVGEHPSLKFHVFFSVRMHPTVPDSSGMILKRALEWMGFGAVSHVVSGRLMRITFTNAMLNHELVTRLTDVAQNMLTNPAIEEYLMSFEVESGTSLPLIKESIKRD